MGGNYSAGKSYSGLFCVGGSVCIKYEQVVCNKILILALLSRRKGMLNNSDILVLIPFAIFVMRHLGKVGFLV